MTRGQCSSLGMVTAGILAMLPPSRALGIIDVTMPDISAFSNPVAALNAALDVFLSGDGTDEMGGYTVRMALTPRAGAVGGISFTGATDLPGLLDTGNLFFGDVPDVDPFVFVTDGLNVGDDPVLATSGELFEMQFEVEPNTVGVFDVDFQFDAPGSEVHDGDFFALTTPANFHNGSITVMLPEPGALWLFASAALLHRRRRNRVHAC